MEIKKIEIIWINVPTFFDIVRNLENTLIDLACDVKTVTSWPSYWNNEVNYIVIPIVRYIDKLLCDMPDNFIFYHIEQQNSYWMTPNYFKIMNQSKVVWSFYPINELSLPQLREKETGYVPFGYHKSMPLNKKKEDYEYDVLFLGSINERRNNIFNQLRDRGLKVYVNSDVTRDEHIRLMMCSKVYLNIHFYGSDSALETARLSLPLSHSKCVVSEPSMLEQENNHYNDLIVITDKIVEKCYEYCNNDELRTQMESGLSEKYSQLCTLTPYLEKRLGDFVAVKPERILYLSANFGNEICKRQVKPATPHISKFICYSDIKKDDDVWEYCNFTDDEILELKDVIYKKANTRPNIIKSRFVKTQCYRLSRVKEFNPSIIIWIDANIEIISDDFHTYCGKSLITLYKHNFVNSAHQDLIFSMNDKNIYLIKRYAYENLQEQLDAYIKDGFTEEISLENKYTCTGIVLMRMERQVEKLLELWWKGIVEWTIHDQVTLSYTLWKSGLPFSLIPEGEIIGSPKHWFWHHD